LSSKEKDKKKELKSFTVGSMQPAAPKSKKPQAKKLEISEKDYPVLGGLLRGGEAKAFHQEVQRVLASTQEFTTGGDSKKKAEAQKVQRAYGLALGLLENSKLVR